MAEVTYIVFSRGHGKKSMVNFVLKMFSEYCAEENIKHKIFPAKNHPGVQLIHIVDPDRREEAQKWLTNAFIIAQTGISWIRKPIEVIEVDNG